MSDLMLFGVLRMPIELWDGGALDVMQRHGRYKQAADRIEADAKLIDELLFVMERARDLIELVETPWDAERLLDEAIAKAGKP